MATRKDDYRPTKTNHGHDIGGGKSHKSGYGHVGNDISSAIDKAAKDRTGKGTR
jgi:hypothetical protein